MNDQSRDISNLLLYETNFKIFEVLPSGIFNIEDLKKIYDHFKNINESLDSNYINQLFKNHQIYSDRGCWINQNVDWSTYQNFKYKDKQLKGHREAFKLLGIELTKRNICHLCDRPGCRNPYHLFQGSTVDNIQDCRNKGRDKYKQQFSLRKISKEEKKLRNRQHWSKLSRFCGE